MGRLCVDERSTQAMFRKLKQRFNRLYALRLLLFCILITIWGCGVSQKAPVGPLELVSRDALPDFHDDLQYKGMIRALNKSIEYLDRLPGDRAFPFGADTYPVSHLKKSLRVFIEFISARPSSLQVAEFIRQNYHVYRSTGSETSKDVLFTGYYEPLLKGSLRQSRKFNHPVYARPNDMVHVDLSQFSSRFEGQKITGRCNGNTFVPYHDRQAIVDHNALDGKAGIIAWVDDPIDLFFLHIQGSGKIELDDGKKINVRYNDQNGRPYRSIGKLLIESNKIPREEMSMQRLKRYLRDNPGDANRILNSNPSFVFFRRVDGGPFGALNVELTPGRSIAVDRKIFPSAVLGYIETEKPVIDVAGNIVRWERCSRFVSSQDTGGAIKGAGRADVFWGHGFYAEIAAGHMKHQGNLYFLILKSDKF